MHENLGEHESADGSDDRPASAGELRLASVVSQLADELQAGKSLSLEQVCQLHPDMTDELREVWGTLVVTDAIAASMRGISSQESHLTDTNGLRSFIPSLPFEIGDYLLEEVIGQGGMGIVYSATQLSLNRTVAVKMLRENRPDSPESRQRFYAEAEANARLVHPGIVPVYEVSEYEGHPFFSMQLVRGATLSQRLQTGPIPQREAAKIMVEVCRAIGFAHQRGILHRDIKPSNILIDERGRALVTDFGLAKLLGSADNLTRTGAVVGTPSYMSPEQASGHSQLVGPRSDVYSLGSMLYHLLTGRPPFIADSPMKQAMQVLEQDAPLPRLLDPSIDRDMEMIVLRTIQKPPDLRYSAAEDLADELQRFLNNEPIQARSGKLGQVIARWFRETHHAVVLENWGLLWMWHSLVLFVVCVSTECMSWAQVESRISYSALWVLGLGTWAIVFWALRRRMGPVTFVERQVAHVWGASMIAIAALAPLEWLLGLPPLKLSPILAIVGSMLFFVKAGIFSGWFYVQSGALIVTSFVMALVPQYAHLIFGIVAGLSFFVPGLKYYRQRND